MRSRSRSPSCNGGSRSACTCWWPPCGSCPTADSGKDDPMGIGVSALAGALLCAGLAPLAGCASSAHSSEREWAAAECGQVIDAEARKKCLERVDDEYGRRH